MGIVRDFFRDLIYGPPSLDVLNARAFNPGDVAVDASVRSFGVPTEEWSPTKYGDYIATSGAIYIVVKKRAKYLSSLPFRLATLKADGTQTDPVTKGALFELTQKVNPYWTFRRLIEMTEMSLCLWGAAYWMLERGASGTQSPRAIFWARPDRVKVFPHATQYVDHFEYEPVSGAEPIRYKPSEVVWFRYPNPLDEYSGLSPLAAARLAADTQSAAMKQNYQLFRNGISIGGLVTPAGDRPMQSKDAEEIKLQLQERAKGTANAHRWLVLLHDAKFTSMTLSPRDAEFVELHKLTLEDVCRAYEIPLDLVGGQRTYANLGDSIKLMWTDTIVPEAAFLADELTEQLLPMFTKPSDRADLCFFDSSGVEALQEDEEAKWRIAEGQIKIGALKVNEWRTDRKLDPVEWGDAWWGSVALVPITTSEIEEPEEEVPALPPGDTESKVGQDEDVERALATLFAKHRALPAAIEPSVRIAYGSEEHERIWNRFAARTEAHESKVARATRNLLRSQEQSILTELGKLDDAERSVRIALPHDVTDLMDKLFSVQKWRRRFREAIRPVFGTIIADAGQTAMDEVMLGGSFDVSDPLVARFLERRSQRFAIEINATTWERLKGSLVEGLDAGEGTDDLAKRVRKVMGDRIRSSGEVIARTEVAASMSGARTEGYRQSGVVEGEQWLAALDERTRESHVAAHGQVVSLGEDFEVGGSRGPGPGLIEAASESINCRCTTIAVLKPLGEE